MIKKFFILLLFFLVIACVPEPIIEEVKKPIRVPEVIQPPEIEQITIENQAFQEVDGVIYIWNYDTNNNLISIKKDEEIITFDYMQGLLTRIANKYKEVLLDYEDGFLKSVINTNMPKKYTVTDGRLTKAGNHGFQYTSKGNLWISKAGMTDSVWYHNDDYSLNAWKRGNVLTEIFYDDKARIKHITDKNNHLIIAYGRDDKIASLSGNLYGLGENFDHLNNEIKVISNINPMSFTGDAKELAFNTYLSCKKFRKNQIPFENIAFAIYKSYFHKDVYEYMIENLYCEWITW